MSYKKQIRKTNLKTIPNPDKHQKISFIKSGVRILGYCFIPFNVIVAMGLLILSEALGIVEELV
jgi:hypothetical protein